MFETAGVLIVNGESPADRKQVLMRSLLAPLMEAFRLLLAKLTQESDEERQTALADCLSHAVGFARYILHHPLEHNPHTGLLGNVKRTTECSIER